MGVLGAVLGILSKLAPALDATARLARAVKESVRPKPPPEPPEPIGDAGWKQARDYLHGYSDATWKRHMDEQRVQAADKLNQAIDEGEAFEPEKPSE